jgi:hypothetical protein
MSKTLQALKKAEQKRRAVLSGGNWEKEPFPLSGLEKAPVRAKDVPLVKTIEYTRTRAMPVDPRILKEQKVMTAQDGRSRVAEQYGLLKAQILKKSHDKGWNYPHGHQCRQGRGKNPDGHQSGPGHLPGGQ